MKTLALLGALLAGLASAPGADSDIFSWGEDVYVASGQTVARDAVCVFCSIHVEGVVSRDAAAVFGNLYVNGEVGRDAAAVGGNLELGPSADVSRDAVAVGGTVRAAAGSHVGRNTFSGAAPWSGRRGLGAAGLFSPFQALPALVLMVVALLLALALPRRLEAAARVVERRPWEAAGLGCLSLFGAVLLSGLFAVTVVLIPFAFLVWLCLAAAWVFGWAALIAWAGHRVTVLSEPAAAAVSLTAVLVGGLLLAVAFMIPVLNLLIFLAGGLLAVGAALGSLFGSSSEGEPFYRSGRLTPPAPPPQA